MNTDKIMFSSFFAALALITWRGFTHKESDWPLASPPPYQYVGAGMTFGILYLVSPLISEKLAATLAVGLLLALAYKTIAPGTTSSGGSSSTTSPAPPTTTGTV